MWCKLYFVKILYMFLIQNSMHQIVMNNKTKNVPWKVNKNLHRYCILAGAFIQSNLLCIQDINFLHFVLILKIEPMTLSHFGLQDC